MRELRIYRLMSDSGSKDTWISGARLDGGVNLGVALSAMARYSHEVDCVDNSLES